MRELTNLLISILQTEMVQAEVEFSNALVRETITGTLRKLLDGGRICIENNDEVIASYANFP